MATAVTAESPLAAETVSKQDRYGALLLALCMFCTGGTGLVIEYVVATTTTFILGSSIIVWSLVIGIMLGAMGLSGWIQERIGDRHLLEKFFAIEVALALAGGYAPIGLNFAYGAFTEHFNLILYSWVILIGLLVGLEIPVVMRIIEQRGIKLRHNLKYVFGADYVGAMVFMFVWVFWLLPNFPITEISFMVAGLNFLVAIGTVWYFHRIVPFKNAAAIIAVTIVAVALTIFGYTNNRSWHVHMEQRLFEDPIVFQTTTPYQHLVITKAVKRCDNGSAEIRLYINGNTQFGSCDEHIYHDNLVHPAMTLAPHPERVLILGGGDGLALRDVLTYKPASVTLVDLDPDMVRIAMENPYLKALNKGAFTESHVVTLPPKGVTQEGGMWQEVRIGTDKIDVATGLEETERVTDVMRMHLDAGKFVESATGVYDVIIIDLPDPNSVELSKLYTTFFYRQVGRHLGIDGIFVVQSASPVHAREVYLEIGRTIEAAGFEAIPYHDNVPSFGEWGWWLACKGEGCEARLRSRIASLQRFKVLTSYLTPERLRANLTFGRVDGKDFEASSVSTRTNTLLDPTLFMRYEASWKTY